MSKQVLSELKLLRAALVHLIGSSGLPEDLQLSPEVLDKASEDYKKLLKMSDQWLCEWDLREYFKTEHHHDIGRFIREQIVYREIEIQLTGVFFDLINKERFHVITYCRGGW